MSQVHSTRITSGFITKSNIANVTRSRIQAYSASTLLLANGSVGTTTFTDSSPNNRTITRLGDTTTSNTQTKFGNVIYFDGTGDALRYEYTADHALGTSDWTTEAWVYLQLTADSSLWSLNTTAVSDAYAAERFAVRTDGSAVLLCANGSTSWINTGNVAVAGQIASNTWVHVACVRSGSDFSCYVNGKRTGGYTSTNTINNFNQQSFIGSSRSNTLPVHTPMRGYMTNFRHTSFALYTSNFTPSTDALTSTGINQVYAHMLMLFNEANGNTAPADSSINSYTFTASGSANVSNVQAKFGTTSLAFPTANSASYITSVYNAAHLLGDTTPFTIEFWVYLNQMPTAGAPAETITWLNNGGNPNNGLAQVRLPINSNGSMYFLVASSTATTWKYELTTASGLITSGQWYHIAAVRENISGNTWHRLYINGVERLSYQNNNNTFAHGNVISIGSFMENGAFIQRISGYIDCLRVIKNYCLYPNGTTFTPSTTELTNSVDRVASVSNNTYGMRKNY